MPEIPEFPGLQIDNFRVIEGCKPPGLCLLTHMHSDHLVGLERKSYKGPFIYCTKATRALVLNIRARKGQGDLLYHHLRKEGGGIEILKGVDFDMPCVLKCRSQQLKVTFLDANHCPGAAMILVESDSDAILYTGDVRCERWWVNALTKHPQMLPFVTRRPITLYVDTTYERHYDPFRSYMDNQQGLKELMKWLNRYPKRYSFNLMEKGTTGFEEVLIRLASRFKSKIHIDPYLYQLYLSAASDSSISQKIVDLCTSDPSDARIHWCSKYSDRPCPIRSQPTTIHIQPIVQLLPQYLEAENAEHIHPPPDLQPDQVIFDATSELSYIWTPEHQLLPKRVRFYFSRHASFPDISRLVRSMVRVKETKALCGKPVVNLEPESNTLSISSAHTRYSCDTIEDKLDTGLASDARNVSILRAEVSHITGHQRKSHVAVMSRPKRLRRKNSNSSSESLDDEARKEALVFLNKNSRVVRELSYQAQIQVATEESRCLSDESQGDDSQAVKSNEEFPLSRLFPHITATTASCSGPSNLPESGTTNTSPLSNRNDEESQEQVNSLPSPPPEDHDPEKQVATPTVIDDSNGSIEAMAVTVLYPEIESTKPLYDFVHDSRLEQKIRQDPNFWNQLEFDWRRDNK